MTRRMCVLDEERACDGCGACDRCDLDPEKICDNCMACVRSGADYLAIEIDEIITDAAAAREALPEDAIADAPNKPPERRSARPRARKRPGCGGA